MIYLPYNKASQTVHKITTLLQLHQIYRQNLPTEVEYGKQPKAEAHWRMFEPSKGIAHDGANSLQLLRSWCRMVV